MADIAARKVDCIVVYKYDRLSRSLRDFLEMMRLLDRDGVTFASVTQQFNTATPIGRLMLHMLLSFAEFEREQISERTRDKIAAARRKGKWSGGMPLLGYDVVETKLVVKEVEAAQVRQIFGLYLERGSLLPTVDEINGRGWTTKRWITKKGTSRGGCPFNKNRLHQLLTNPTYLGKTTYKDEVHEGEHDSVVDSAMFERVRQMLKENGRSGCAEKRNKHEALLRGLLRCAACDCGMTHTYTTKGNRRYRYYVCNRAQQQGRAACPAPSVPAGEIERFIVEQITEIGQDPALVAATWVESRRLADEAIKQLKKERAAFERQRRADAAEVRRLVDSPTQDGALAHVAELQERLGQAEIRLGNIDGEIAELVGQEIKETDVAAALSEFDSLWAALTTMEQARILALLIARVDYDGQQSKVVITFRPIGVKTLTAEATIQEETAA